MDRSSLRWLTAVAAFTSSVLLAQHRPEPADSPSLLPPASAAYIPTSQDNGDIPADATRERPHTAIERAQRAFEERVPAFPNSEESSRSSRAGTVSVDEARHPLSGKGERLIEKGQQYAGAGEHEKAIDTFKQALGERSSAPYAHSLLGVEYLKMLKIPAAIDQLRAAVQSMPGVSANHSNLGYAYFLTGKREAAERELRAAIQLDQTSPQPRFLLGLLLLDQKSAEAGEHLQFAQRLIRRASLALAIFHTRHGESDAVQKDLRGYLGSEWPQEAQNAEQWVGLAARLERPSVLFGMPDRPVADAPLER